MTTTQYGKAMYFEHPYAVPQPYAIPQSQLALRPPNRMNLRRNATLRYFLICMGSLCCLLIIGTVISLFVYFYFRYRNNVSSLLSYPEFVCSQGPCGCPNYNYGQPSTSRIVGGKDVLPFTYPWLVTIVDQYGIDPFCAGFIISYNTILTAAHCLIGRNPKQLQILARIHDLRQFNGERYDIEKWYIHPEYTFNDSMQLNDIALVKINRAFSYDLRPCCLPSVRSSMYPEPKTAAVASGWGKLASKPNSRSSHILQHVVMPIVDENNRKCRQSMVDSNRQLCAGYDKLSIDTCSGDSGSPLLVVEYSNKKQGHFVATGIVSYGNTQCDASISSGVYTRVGFYLPWIERILSNV
ncbi:unnamed protein product [Rotaria magnacalcarata]|uniref:Peptidase S1 domain-containing protein n=1 Tax=Rotaria magnacalcarata TaxID=392030 RepID=A0A817AAA2_9BILA|nr:unnamed protein product [Rotaria magnacalcarata]CAF3775028.1 unnamed protein product [Rotaria magnacalcarata]